MSVSSGRDGEENLETKLFRLIRTQSLRDLVLAFRRSGMYEKTSVCYDYLRAIYPVDSEVGEGIVLSEQGQYVEAVEKLLKMERECLGGKLSPDSSDDQADRLNLTPVSQLNLYISLTVIIVMNRVSQYKAIAKRSFEIMEEILSKMEDGKRDNYQLARYYNVQAAYYEWECDYEDALATYSKGLKAVSYTHLTLPTTSRV